MNNLENNNTHLITDLLSGDESILEREDYKNLDFTEIQEALNLIKNKIMFKNLLRWRSF